nr:uncharacterized protein LOC112036061 [Quercus suber]
MAAAMTELSRQNQELVRQLDLRKQRHEWNTEERDQSQEEERNVEPKNQSRGTASRRVPHLEREMDQMRRVMDKMRENMRKTNPVEDSVHRIDSPFMASINAHPLPPKFKMPLLDSAFPTTLKGPARVWFSKIPPNTVISFEKLSRLFVNNFIGGQRHKRSSSSLLTIEQGKNESLWSFITRFNRDALTVDEVDDKLLLAAFYNGVHSDLFIHKLYEQVPQTMAELVHSTQNFMNARDAIIAKKRKRVEKVEANPMRQSEQGPCPKKGRTENKKDREKKADECFDLKQQIENLIRQGKLRNFLERDHKDEKLKGKVEESSRPPLGEIRIILGGSSIGQTSKSKKAYLKVVQNVQLSGQSPRARTTDEQAITFKDEDAERIHHPHDDAIVITFLIAKYKTRRAMNIEEKRVVAEPAEVLEDVSFDETNPEMCTRIGADLEGKIKEDLI